MAMGFTGYRWVLYIIILPLVCQFGCKNGGQCEDITVNYHCEGDRLMLVKKAYSCSDDRCSQKLYETTDVQDVWSACNMRNTCDVTIRHHFLIMQHDCVQPEETSRGDICGAERLILNPGPGKFFLHNPGYPDQMDGEIPISCTCRANLSYPVSVTMRYLQTDLPDDSLRILWDDLGGSPNGSTETIAPKRRLELVYRHSNSSSFWFQVSVNDSVELICENDYPIVIMPSSTTVNSTLNSAVLPRGMRIWIILGASSGVICIFIILVPILVIFICRQRKRRAAKLRAWNEMVENAKFSHNPTTIQRGTDRIRKLPKDGTTLKLYQSVDETGGQSLDGDDSGWELVTPSKRTPGALSLNRPPPKKGRQGQLPPEPKDMIDKDTPYYMYETLPKDKAKHHPYQAIDELESAEEDSIGQIRRNDLDKSRENVGPSEPADDWSDLYQMASTLGRAESDSPEEERWKTNDIYQFTNLRDGDRPRDLPTSGTSKFPERSGGTARLPTPGVGGPSRSPHSGREALNPPDSGRGTLDNPRKRGESKSPNTKHRPDSSSGVPKVPYSSGGTAKRPNSIGGSTSPPSGEGTGKFPYSPPGTYDNARDVKKKPAGSNGYDNCGSPEVPEDEEEWLKEKEREKAQLEAAFHDIGKTLSRIKDDIHTFKRKKKPKPSGGPEDVYEEVS